MAFEFGETIDSFTDGLLNNGPINTMAANPIYTAFFISVAIVFITFITFYKYQESELGSDLFTMGFYSFFASLFIVFLNNRALIKDCSSEAVEF